LDEHRLVKWPANKIVAGENNTCSALNQLLSPYQLFIDGNRSVFMADRDYNHWMKWSAGTK
jgi:hypothetical protein